MRISIFGLGYVGCVTAGCLTSHGYDVVGVDINNRKVEQINSGTSPVSESGLAPLITEAVDKGMLSASSDPVQAVEQTELSLVCVGTPERTDGKLDTTNLYNVIDSIAPAVDEDHTVAIRSTAPPGTTRNLKEYLNDQRPERKQPNFVVNPEFLREGTAIADFKNPPYTVIGKFTEEETAIDRLYYDLPINGKVHTVSPETAELLKLTNNSFHALKIAFANEIGSIASEYGVDGTELLDLVTKDTKLNISDAYMDPGFAYGGACLPKDTQATEQLGREQGLQVPLIESITEANHAHIERIAEEVDATTGDVAGIVGISFKEDTHDVRNSPAIELAKIIDKEIAFLTPDINFDKFVGSNRSHFDKSMEKIDPQMFHDVESFTNACDMIIFTNNGEYENIINNVEKRPVFDPVGALTEYREQISEYKTISW